MLLPCTLYPTVFYGEPDKIKNEPQFLKSINVIRKETFAEYLELLDKGNFEHLKGRIPKEYWRADWQGESSVAKEEHTSASK